MTSFIIKFIILCAIFFTGYKLGKSITENKYLKDSQENIINGIKDIQDINNIEHENFYLAWDKICGK